MSRIAVYPGSFDPFTTGHMDILHNAVGMFDKVYVGVLNNSAKKNVFTPQERVEMIERAVKTAGYDNVEVGSFDGLLVEYTRLVGASYIVRGLRAITDFEYEFQISAINRHMEPEVKTVYFMASPELSFLSSSTIREIAPHGASISGLVPECNEKMIQERLLQER